MTLSSKPVPSVENLSKDDATTAISHQNDPGLFGRRDSLLGALHCLWALHPIPCNIVETGTLRDDRAGATQSDGWSTMAWGWYATQCRGHVWTVDVDAAALSICQRLTQTYKSNITYVCQNSLAFLQGWVQESRIQLLYLDSLDYVDREHSEAHQLAEVQAALPHLDEVCLVLMDDTSPAPRSRPRNSQEKRYGRGYWEGKGAQSIPFLLDQGFEVVQEPNEHWSNGGQVLLARGAPVGLLHEVLARVGCGEGEMLFNNQVPFSAKPKDKSYSDTGTLTNAEITDNEIIKSQHFIAEPTTLPEPTNPELSNLQPTNPNPDLPQSTHQTFATPQFSGLQSISAKPFIGATPFIGAMPSRQRHWQQLPLHAVAYQFAHLATQPHLMQYLAAVLRYCPRGARALEVETGTGLGSERFAGLGAIWLSLRGVEAAGCDNVPILLEQGRYANSALGGSARFETAELFDLYQCYAPKPEHGSLSADEAIPDSSLNAELTPRPFQVIHHYNLLQQFALPWMQALLAQQVALADWVIFSVPSVYGDESTEQPLGEPMGQPTGEPQATGRLLPLEEWQRVLEPFEVEELRYCGTSPIGGQNSQQNSPDSSQEDEPVNRSHILCVLRGVLRGQATQTATEKHTAIAKPAGASQPNSTQQNSRQLKSLMQVREEPYPDGISAIVHTRNEERHIADCLSSLVDWTDEIIVCDMESTDRTVEIARRFTDHIIAHPRLSNFDQSRNVLALRARYRWVFYLDADERVPAALGHTLRAMVMGRNPPFAGLLPPFRHCFAGQWLQSLYPGYTAPRLFKNGRFLFNARLHSGCEVDGPLVCFPADNPDLSLLHFSYDSVAHYLDKFNRYTDGEANNMERDGRPFHWQEAIRHWANDLSSY